MAKKKTSPDLDHFFVFEARCLMNPLRNGMLEWKDVDEYKRRFNEVNHAFFLANDFVTSKGYLDPADAMRNFNHGSYYKKVLYGNEVFVAVNENPDHSTTVEIIYYDREAKRYLALPANHEDFTDFGIIDEHQAKKLYDYLFGFVTDYMKDLKSLREISDEWLSYEIF